MKKMMNAIMETRCQDVYPLPIDMGAFKKKFAVIMASLEQAKEEMAFKEAKFDNSGDCADSEKAYFVKDTAKKKSTNNVQQWFKDHKAVAPILIGTSGAAVMVAAILLGIKKKP